MTEPLPCQDDPAYFREVRRRMHLIRFAEGRHTAEDEAGLVALAVADGRIAQAPASEAWMSAVAAVAGQPLALAPPRPSPATTGAEAWNSVPPESVRVVAASMARDTAMHLATGTCPCALCEACRKRMRAEDDKMAELAGLLVAEDPPAALGLRPAAADLTFTLVSDRGGLRIRPSYEAYTTAPIVAALAETCAEDSDGKPTGDSSRP
jgi:hypothetical protein